MWLGGHRVPQNMQGYGESQSGGWTGMQGFGESQAALNAMQGLSESQAPLPSMQAYGDSPQALAAMHAYAEAQLALTPGDFSGGLLVPQMPVAPQMPLAPQMQPLTNSLELMQMAGLTANKQALMQHQLEQQAATQLQMQVQLEQQAALIQWQRQQLGSRLSQGAPSLVPSLEQQVAIQLQRQAQLEQQAALIQFQSQALESRIAQAAPLMSQQAQLEANAAMAMLPACAGNGHGNAATPMAMHWGAQSVSSLEQPGVALRYAARSSHGLSSAHSVTEELMQTHSESVGRKLGGREPWDRKVSEESNKTSGHSQASQKSRSKGIASPANQSATQGDYANRMAYASRLKQIHKDSMRDYLADLRNEDPKCVFITRRIKDLGFQSKELLKQHFSQYGAVKQVLIPQTKVKPFREPIAGSATRTRPGNFGLVVMSSQQVVRRILENEHTINGLLVEVQVFELVARSHDNMSEVTEAEAKDESQEDKSVAGKAPPSSGSGQEVGESRSGGCSGSGEKPGSSNDTPNGENGGSNGSSKPNGGSNGTTTTATERSHGGDARPMSVGDWRQSRATAAGAATTESAAKPQSTSPQETSASQKLSSGSPSQTRSQDLSDSLKESSKESGTSQKLPDTDSSGSDPAQNQPVTMQAVMGAIARLAHEPTQAGLADEMIQTVSEILSAPENEGQSDECRAKLATCLRVASDRLRLEADSLQGAAMAPASPVLPQIEPPMPLVSSTADRSDAQFAMALAVEAGRFSCHTQGASSLQYQMPVQPLATPFHMPMPVPMSVPVLGGAPPGLSNGVANSDDGMAEAKPHMLTLRSHLKEVSAEDPACIFVTRKIHTLGFHSHKKLREHYMQYGVVVRVLVAHRKLKGAADSSGQFGQQRTRPGSFGIILMKTAASVQKILALGQEQVVAGHKISVELFEPPKEHATDLSATDYASTTAESGNSDGKRWSRRGSPDCHTMLLQTSAMNTTTWSRPGRLEMTIPESEAEAFPDYAPGY